MNSFPKIFALGDRHTMGIFDDEVEITEKIDGSQIGFGLVNGELFIRSKGKEITNDEDPNSMFKTGISIIKNLHLCGLLTDGILFYGEYLKSNKHNALTYGRAPTNNIVLYGAFDIYGKIISRKLLELYAGIFGLETVPILFKGKLDHQDLEGNRLISELMNKDSILGNTKPEGLVIKNYHREVIINRGEVIIPIMMAKHVSENFKEVHQKDWKSKGTRRGKWDTYKSQFCSTARWEKAVQHLRDSGKLDINPKDIGILLKEISVDIEVEEKDNIKEWLWNNFGREILKEAVKGFPEWYRDKLSTQAIVPIEELDEFKVDLGGC